MIQSLGAKSGYKTVMRRKKGLPRLIFANGRVIMTPLIITRSEKNSIDVIPGIHVSCSIDLHMMMMCRLSSL